VIDRAYKVIVAQRVQDRMDEHARWWRKNRRASGTSFGDALTAAYASIRRAPKLGVRYDVEGSDLEVWTTQLVTGHMLYFRLVQALPLPVYIRVIGIKGPGEAEPFLAV
jgi:hypothetical protein